MATTHISRASVHYRRPGETEERVLIQRALDQLRGRPSGGDHITDLIEDLSDYLRRYDLDKLRGAGL